MIKVSNNLIKIFKNSSQYMIISIVGAIVNIIMVKYYTVSFSKVEYGVMSFYLSFFYFFTPLVSLGVDSSFERIYYDYRVGEERRNLFLQSTICLLFRINLLILTISMLVAPIINSYLGGNIGLYVILLVVTVLCSWENFFSKINIVEQNANLFLKSKLLYYIVANGISVLCITFLIKRIEIRFLGLGFGYIASILCSIIYYKRKKFLVIDFKKIDKQIIREVVGYSLPILITLILTTSFSYVDKIFIRIYSDFGNMAEYSVAQNIGKIMSLFIESFTMAITPVIINELNFNYKKTMIKLKKINLVYVISLIIIGSTLILCRKKIILILATKEYANSTGVFLFIIMAYLVAGTYKIPSILLMYHKRVKLFPFLGVINLLSNVLFNQLFIGKFGIVGVAFASYLSMIVYAMFNYIFASKYMYSKVTILIAFGILSIISAATFNVFF